MREGGERGEGGGGQAMKEGRQEVGEGGRGDHKWGGGSVQSVLLQYWS